MYIIIIICNSLSVVDVFISVDVSIPTEHHKEFPEPDKLRIMQFHSLIAAAHLPTEYGTFPEREEIIEHPNILPEYANRF